MEYTKTAWPTESTKHGTYGCIEMEVAKTGSLWVCTGFSAYLVRLLGCVLWVLRVSVGVSLTLFPALRTLFLLLSYMFQTWCKSCLILF